MARPKILIVDDEKPTRDVMARILSSAYDCQTAPDAEQALACLAATPDLALLMTDYKMPGDNGITLIRKAKALNPALACILITAFGEIELAVEAMKDGADDFLAKPITDIAVLERRVAKAIEKNAAVRAVDALPAADDTDSALASFIGRSPAMERIYTRLRKVAPTDATVLIEGPSGSGKELTARALHDLSKRAKGPFVAVECASLPSTLLETELFGAVKGAFTDATDRVGCFEKANGGTLFLDEIGEIDLSVQVKLLRVLESRTFQRVGETKDRTSDFRLVAATNRNLAKLVYDGTFREDLYYRLNVIDIRTPALCDHPEDIPDLIHRFIREFASADGTAVSGIDAAAIKALQAYAWPGNVRQLRNVIEKMTVLASGPRLTLEDVPEEIREPSVPFAPPPAAAPIPVAQPAPAPAADGLSLAEREKAQILAVLAACGNNKSKAAQQLGISRRTLHRKLTEWSAT